MKKTKLEEYVIANGLLCSIEMGVAYSYCCLHKKEDLYLTYYKSKTLNGAIDKAISAHRGKFGNNNRSKQEIQDEKRLRMLRQRFSDKK